MGARTEAGRGVFSLAARVHETCPRGSSEEDDDEPKSSESVYASCVSPSTERVRVSG